MIDVISSFLEYFIPFIFVLGILIFVHELGHFLVAKKSGIKVEVFSLGYAPKMFGRQVGETEYRISWIPFGGYVKLAGQADVGKPDIEGQPWEYPSKPIPVRMAVIAAGPAMNFFLAFLLLFLLLYTVGTEHLAPVVGVVEERSIADQAGFKAGDRILSVGGTSVTDWDAIAEAFLFEEGVPLVFGVERDGAKLSLTIGPEIEENVDFGLYPYLPARVASVVHDSPAERAGIIEGDLITSIDGEAVYGWEDMRRKIWDLPGDTLLVSWMRDGVEHQAHLVPITKRMYNERNEKIEYGVIGIARPVQYKRMSLLAALKYGAWQTYEVTGEIFQLIRKLLTGRASPKLLGGPLMIAEMAGESARAGLRPLFYFIAFLSVNLGLINILPIPALDGGHLLFLTVEAILRRPLSMKQRAIVQQIGLALLLFLMVYVMFNDISRYFIR